MSSAATPPYLGQLFTVCNQVLRKTTVQDSRSLDSQTQEWFFQEQDRTLCHERRTSTVVDVSEIPIFGEKRVVLTGNVSEPWHVSCDISDLG